MKKTIMACLLFFTFIVYVGDALAFTEGPSNNYFGTGAGGAGGSWNSFFGANTGILNNGNSNTFSGYRAGDNNTTGSNNTFIGKQAGSANTYGGSNTYIGESSGILSTSAINNTFIGSKAGYSNNYGGSNTFVGRNAGYSNTTGYYNTFLGMDSGYTNSTGVYNVFIGYRAGYNETGSNKLYIDNTSTSSPLIYGDFGTNTVTVNGGFTATSLTGDGSGLTNVAPAAHNHSGADVTSGTVAETYIDSAIARDTEIMSTVLANDGSTSTLDADLLDGQDSTGFAKSVHNHSGADVTSGTVAETYIDSAIARDTEIMSTVLANDGSTSTLDADLLDGQDSSAFMSASTDNWVDTTGDTMTGGLVVEGSVEIDLDLIVNGNTYVDSDETLKKDIKTIESSIEKIKHIRGVSFAWKKSTNRASTRSEGKHYGVIAQDVEQVLPEIVKVGKNNTKKVAYMELIPVLIEAVKEQQKIYDDKFKHQQETISELLEKVEMLERQAKLKNSMAMADIK